MGAGLLDLCEKYFGARDFYEVLQIQKNSNDKQGKIIIITSVKIYYLL